jgi:hypothetical protein
MNIIQKLKAAFVENPDEAEFAIAPTVTKQVSTTTPSNQPGTGALLDTRTDAEKETDIQAAEVYATAAAVNWAYKPQSAWRAFPVFDQGAGEDCVANTTAKILGVLRFLKDGMFIKFSAGYVYRQRSNYPQAGMIGADAFAIGANGVTLDSIVPSTQLTEQSLNSLTWPEYADEIAKVFKFSSGNPVVLATGDIDAVASVIQQTGKPVMVWYFFTAAEWSAFAPTVANSMQINDAQSLHHSVTAVDFVLDANGNKTLIIEDSAHFGGLAVRQISAAWHAARNFYAAYPMNLQSVQTMSVGTLPKYTFAKQLVFIPWDSTSNAPSNTTLNAAQLSDVQALQQILQVMTNTKGETYFPTNVSCTGYYGALTAAAVYEWQTDNQVAPQSTLDGLQGKSFGQLSYTVMNTKLSA